MDEYSFASPIVQLVSEVVTSESMRVTVGVMPFFVNAVISWEFIGFRNTISMGGAYKLDHSSNISTSFDKAFDNVLTSE